MNETKRAGFTLVELMIALVAGAFAVAAVYYLNGVSSRSFAEQMRVSETQMSLRSAMEQLRRDFSRAGYLAAPSTRALFDCGGARGGASADGAGDLAPRWVRGLNVVRDGSLALSTEVTGMLGTPTTNLTRADTVDLYGNYATPEVYLVDGDRSNDTKIFFQNTSEAFRRSFYDPAASLGVATYSQARFEAVFKLAAPGRRLVRIENSGHVFFREIASVDAVSETAVSITLNTALPFCFMSGSWTGIAPVLHLQYAIESDSEAELARLRTAETAKGASGTATPGSRRTMLVRRELDDSTGTPTRIANTSRMVLDYAVEFGVDYFVNTDTSVPPALPLRPEWLWTRALTTGIANPERVRSVVATLTARSAESDPRLPVMARAPFDVADRPDGPLRLFRVIDPAATGLVMNARVRTLRSEIFLHNF